MASAAAAKNVRADPAAVLRGPGDAQLRFVDRRGRCSVWSRCARAPGALSPVCGSSSYTSASIRREVLAPSALVSLDIRTQIMTPEAIAPFKVSYAQVSFDTAGSWPGRLSTTISFTAAPKRSGRCSPRDLTTTPGALRAAYWRWWCRNLEESERTAPVVLRDLGATTRPTGPCGDRRLRNGHARRWSPRSGSPVALLGQHASSGTGGPRVTGDSSSRCSRAPQCRRAVFAEQLGGSNSSRHDAGPARRRFSRPSRIRP
jgi:hypothetical protein